MGTVTWALVARCVGLILVLLPAAVLPGQPGAAQTPHPPPIAGAPHGTMRVTVHEGRLSLWAQEAPLKAIFDAIGRQLAIDVVSRIPDDERITLAFAALPLAEALKRFRPYVNYLVVEDAAEAPGNIRKLIVVSKRATGMLSLPIKEDGKGVVPSERRRSEAPTSGAPLRPKPFTFEFDPTAVGGRRR
jgi:hypothetical protein